MKAYKNLSRTTKTVYGVKFRPGEVQVVPGPVNDSTFVEVAVPKPPVPAEVEVREVVSEVAVPKSTKSTQPEKPEPAKKADKSSDAVKKKPGPAPKQPAATKDSAPETKEANLKNSIEEVISNGEDSHK